MMRVPALVMTMVLLPVMAWAGPLHVGVRAGLGLTSLHGDFADIASPEYKPGFQGGVVLEFSPAPIGLTVEALYVQKGAEFKSFVTDDTGNVLASADSHLELTYLEIPVLVTATAPARGAVAPYVVIGPSFGIALDAEGTGSGPDVDFSDDMKTLDLCGAFGLGARFGSGPWRFGIETRYTTGFSDLWDLEDNLESINHGFALTLSVTN
jgi:hypothetical protein